MPVLSEEILYQLLDIMPVARLGLIDSVGLPEAMPIVFARVGDGLFSPIDGKPKSSAKLARIKLVEISRKVLYYSTTIMTTGSSCGG